MHVLKLVDERLSDYRLPMLMLVATTCDWKCAREAGFPVSLCQNHAWKDVPSFIISPEEIYQAYEKNPITQGLLFGGLEPLRQFSEMAEVIQYFRRHERNAPVVIYTGYTEKEIAGEVEYLSQWPNIIVKFGRYVPNQTPHYDSILGVKLASDNQYAKRISKEFI